MPDFWMRMEKVDAGLTERATVLRDHVFSDGALPRSTKEGAIRFPDGIRIHARRALEHGATPAQVQEAVALSVVAAGIPRIARRSSSCGAPCGPSCRGRPARERGAAGRDD